MAGKWICAKNVFYEDFFESGKYYECKGPINDTNSVEELDLLDKKDLESHYICKYDEAAAISIVYRLDNDHKTGNGFNLVPVWWYREIDPEENPEYFI